MAETTTISIHHQRNAVRRLSVPTTEGETENYVVPRRKQKAESEDGSDDPDAVAANAAQLSIRPSRKLRDLVQEMESTEGSLLALKEENAKLKLKCLNNMMGSAMMGQVAASGMGGSIMLKNCFQRWQSVREDLRTQRQISELKMKLMEKKSQAMAKMFGGQTRDTLKHCFKGWFNALEAIKDEKQVLDELAAHRAGRGQLIAKYHELEQDFVNERTRGQELESQLQETIEAIEHYQADMSFSKNRLEELNAEHESQKNKSRELNETLDEYREKQTVLRRELQQHTEKTQKLQTLLDEEEREKRDLSERLVAVEQSIEGLRNETTRGVSKLQRYEALAKEKDERIHALQAQLEEAQGCISSLQYGANVYLHENKVQGDQKGARTDFDDMRDKIDALMQKIDWKEYVARGEAIASPPLTASKPEQVILEAPASPSVTQTRTVLLPSGPTVPGPTVVQRVNPSGLGLSVTVGQREQERTLLQPMGQQLQSIQTQPLGSYSPQVPGFGPPQSLPYAQPPPAYAYPQAVSQAPQRPH